MLGYGGSELPSPFSLHTLGSTSVDLRGVTVRGHPFLPSGFSASEPAAKPHED